MVYSIGGTIEASDYNDLIAQINDIFGVGNGNSGYGGNSVNIPSFGDLVDASEGDDVTNEMWLDLRNAFEDCANHQDTTLTDGLPSVDDIEDDSADDVNDGSSDDLDDGSSDDLDDGSADDVDDGSADDSDDDSDDTPEPEETEEPDKTPTPEESDEDDEDDEDDD